MNDSVIQDARKIAANIEMSGGCLAASTILRLADELEARQPTEDDREALVKEAQAHATLALARVSPNAHIPWVANLVREVAEVSVDLTRAAVPDAATGNVQKMYDRACADIQEYGETIKGLEAERDAALAAIERVRAIHERDMVLRDYCSECSDFGSDQFPPGQMVEWPCRTVAALDGAPEPEWEYADSEGEPGPHHLTRFSADLSTLARRNENRKRLGHEPLPIYRRRKAGPWGRVDGSES